MFASASRVSLITGLLGGTTLAAASVFVAWRGSSGSIAPGGVVLVMGAFASVAGTLGNISSPFVAVAQHTTFLEDYFSFLSIGRRGPFPAAPRAIAAPRID